METYTALSNVGLDVPNMFVGTKAAFDVVVEVTMAEAMEFQEPSEVFKNWLEGLKDEDLPVG